MIIVVFIEKYQVCILLCLPVPFLDLFSSCSQMMNYGRYEDGAEYADFSGQSVQIKVFILFIWLCIFVYLCFCMCAYVCLLTCLCMSIYVSGLYSVNNSLIAA